jgi:excisionase family DNA binding protein
MAVLTTPQAVDFLAARAAESGKRRPIGADTLTRWAREGTIPAVKYGRGWLFSEEALTEALRTFGAEK